RNLYHRSCIANGRCANAAISAVVADFYTVVVSVVVDGGVEQTLIGARRILLLTAHRVTGASSHVVRVEHL
ncbi:hypothetical protein PENTCL1PPCAC_14948, partial [Pristionchus entomophagus]